ncbi:MAG: methyltransferase, TIGR04325 family [Pseudomonadota bacterium]
MIEFGKRVSRHLWRVPGFGQALAYDYSRYFATRPANRFRGVYPDFATAEASIPHGQRIGYDSEALASMYRDRMEKACQSDYAVLFWLRDLLDKQTVLFDFGGHIGVSYYGWKAYLQYPPGMRWTVYEVPAIASAGAKLAQERSAAGLGFVSELSADSGCTVFLAAGSLQYVDMTLPEILGRIGTLPRHLIVNKMPLYDGETFVTVQSTGRAFHPYRIHNRTEFVNGVVGLGYRVIDDWVNREQHCEIPFTRGRDIDAYSGYFFERT